LQNPAGILARSEWRNPVNRFRLTRVALAPSNLIR
jgi:hypothetical protein